MQALIVVDAQNEFSATGLRPVPNHAGALEHIRFRIQQARQLRQPIAWIIHYNKPTESRAFVPGTWGAQPSPGLGPELGFGPEKRFEKDVYGAFSGTGLEEWLRSLGAQSVLLVGFYTHMCLSTSAREALVRGFDVAVDPAGSGGRKSRTAPCRRSAPVRFAAFAAHGSHDEAKRAGRLNRRRQRADKLAGSKRRSAMRALERSRLGRTPLGREMLSSGRAAAGNAFRS
jgi:nicotinamidase-related amidase